MSVNLVKGQKVDLTKGNAGLKSLIVGLGWDEANTSGGGGFLGLFKKKQEEIDCDASALMLSGGRIAAKDDIVYFGNLIHSSGALRHQGDNLTGAGDGDCEQIMIFLDKVPGGIDKIVLVVNIFQAVARKQHFGMVGNAYIRIVNADTNQELCRYNLTENYSGMMSMIFGEVYRDGNEWKFEAIGQGTNDPGLPELTNRYK